MIKKITLVFAIAFFSIYAQAQSFTALYTFDSVKTTSGLVDPTAVPVAAGVTFGSFSAAGVSVNPTATGRFSYKTWSTGAVNGSDIYANLTGALNPAEYFEVTVTPNSGYKLSLTGITFKMLRSSTGVRTYSVRSSADGFAANLPASINPVNTKLSVQSGNVFFWNNDTASTSTSQAGNTITLSGASFSNITSAVKFRFYAWNAESTAGTFSLDNVSIAGAASHSIANFAADTVCLGDSTSFLDLSMGGLGGPITSWAWNFGDNSSVDSTQNPVHQYFSSGIYSVTLVVRDSSLHRDTAAAMVIVDSVGGSFVVSVTGHTATFTGVPTGRISPFYFWDFGDSSPVNYLLSPVHTYSVTGTFSACFTVADSTSGCIDSVCHPVVIIATGIAANTSEVISIYPNPSANGLFTVGLGNYSNKTIVTVYNIIGKIIFTKELNSSDRQLIDLSAEANGCYFIGIKNDRESSIKKITINK